jgi:hypothetical protein
MPTATADQGIVLPVLPDPANVPSSMTSQTSGLESRTVKRYTNDADRAARNPAPVAGEVCWITALARHEFWTGAAWWELRPLYVNKATEVQVVNNSTAFVNDSHLLLAMRASARYRLSGLVVVDSGTTGDFKMDWTGPAGFAMGRWTLTGVDTGGTNFAPGGASAASTVVSRGGLGIGTFAFYTLTGIVTTAGTAGNLQMRWAQNALEAVNTRVKNDSYIQLERIG